MPWTPLPTDYTNATYSGRKKYNQINNNDGTVSFEDVTSYQNLQKSYFGALDANRMTSAINTLMTNNLGLKPCLSVTAPVGAVISVTGGTSNYSPVTSTQNVTRIELDDYGTYTVQASINGEQSNQITLNVDTVKIYPVTLKTTFVYGISRNVTASSPLWTRTDDSVGMTATASVGTTAGASDFDNHYPWSGIVRENIGTDIMVKIPKFWYRRYKEGNIEHIKIAPKATSGFVVHPAFLRGNVEKDYIHIGAYKTSSNHISISGAMPLVSQTRAAMRTSAKNKGAGWGLIDVTSVSALTMLILVEYATCNVQAAIGQGYCDENSGAIASGTTNNVPNLTGRPAGTDGKVDVVWRGLEGLWGNVWEWTDGLNLNNGNYWFCNNPSQYADDTTANYTQLSYTASTSWSHSYITTLGLDTNKSCVMLPSVAGTGSETTHMCDACSTNTAWKAYRHGGDWSTASENGLFTTCFRYSSSFSNSYTGSRLLKIPS